MRPAHSRVGGSYGADNEEGNMRTTAGVIVLATVVAGLGASGAAFGDGMSFKDGRYADGPVTVLTLSNEQLVTVKTKRVVVLTKSQRDLLTSNTGLAPSVLQVYSVRAAGQDCTCFDYNVSIWFAPRQIEVPHHFLVSDTEAERKADEQEVIE
jgi:hypothetical protein